ncbi:hypothetical protein G9A89_005385 [Geosiphon pyriformis]|nr:hypothetical protein G9A89_005385 [Geosiphon pyriformis]
MATFQQFYYREIIPMCWISGVSISYAESIATNDTFPNFLFNKSINSKNITTVVKYETQIMNNSFLLTIPKAKEKSIHYQKRESQASLKPDKILLPNGHREKILIENNSEMAKYASCLNPKNSKIKVLTNQFYVNIFTLKEERSIQVLFRGKELDFRILKQKRTMKSYQYVEDAMVDTEFYTEFQKGWPKLAKLFLNKRKLSFSEFEYKFIGHGIGGAALNFLDMNQTDGYKYNATIFTFGQPRIGNSQFANYVHQKLNGRVYRVTNYNDWVPKFPKFTSKHPYLHHTREYWFGQLDCDCILSSTITYLDKPLYRCPVPIKKKSGMRMESPFCNAAVESNDLESAHKAHLGPYFKNLMVNCPPMESYYNI